MDDGGVLTRLHHRTRGIAITSAVLAAVLAVTAWVWPRWATNGTGAQLVAGLVVAVAVGAAWWFAVQAGRWSGCAMLEIERAGVAGTLGTPAPMVGRRVGAPIRRRLPPVIVPVRADLPGLRDGEALVVHARKDELALAAGDDVRIAAAGARGPWLIRRGDGAVFAAERGVTGFL